jgi:seryl-tRNA synthetase
LRGWGARLERALQSFMIDMHVTRHGYTEIAPPLVALGDTLRQTGHLPHFSEGMYRLAGDADAEARCLNPTAEVPLVALHAGETLAPRRLPLRYVAGIASFRREAGSPGRQTRGLLRRNQFQKVELVLITTPEQAQGSYDVLTAHATAVLAALELPYRVVELPGNELSFAAQRGRDIEAWFPGLRAWVEVSSISDCGAFQARRASIRIAGSRAGPRRFAHTLNGSGLAVGRTLAALLENAQTPASIEIPRALRPYLGGMSQLPDDSPAEDVLY